MKSICVFCGSNSGNKPEYPAAARALGALLASRQIEIIYGGASVGTMGALAEAALQAGGTVTGVMPQSLIDKGVAHISLTQLHVVLSMHERKAKMAELADGFIVLPGGFGTLDELFEILTWAQLGLHTKPCGLLNVSGFFAPLLAALDHNVNEGFIRPEHRAMLLVNSDATRLLDSMAAYRAPVVGKWTSNQP
jgi:uncharacterized protein (TIGR00730 family)